MLWAWDNRAAQAELSIWGLKARESTFSPMGPISPLFGVLTAIRADRHMLAVKKKGEGITRSRLWNLANGRQFHCLPIYRSPPGLIMELMEEHIEFSPDGKLLAAGDTLTSLSLWDVATGGLYRRFHSVDIEMGFAFTRWQTPCHGRPALPLLGHRAGSGNPPLSRQPDYGRRCLYTRRQDPDHSGGFRLQLWDPATGQEIHRLRSQHRFRDLVYPKDSAWREDRSSGGHQPTITAMAIAPDGKTLAAGAEDGSLWLLDLSTDRELLQLQGRKGPIEAIVFASSGTTFAAADDRGIWVGDTKSGNEINRFPGPAKGSIRTLAVSPDGASLASATIMGCRSGT